MIGRCQTAIRGFSGFPAGSLPGLRFLPSVVAKSMISRDFPAWGEPRKIFSLSFPVWQGTGEAALPPRFGPFGAAAATGSAAMARSRRASSRFSLRRFGRRGALSVRIPHCATARPRSPSPADRSCDGWIKSFRDFGAAKPERIRVGPVRCRLTGEDQGFTGVGEIAETPACQGCR